MVPSERGAHPTRGHPDLRPAAVEGHAEHRGTDLDLTGLIPRSAGVRGIEEAATEVLGQPRFTLTTKLYDRTRDQIILDEVERIAFEQRDPSRGETMAAKDKVVTIYAPHNVGFMKCEGKLLDFGEKPYAQYDKMPYVTFVPRGKRKPKTLSENFLILDGVGYPDPPDAWVHDQPKEGSPFASGKYPMFDPRYNIEFNEVINPYSSQFLVNYRRNKTTALSEEDRRWIERSEAPAKRYLPSAGDFATPTDETFDEALLSDLRKRAMASVVRDSDNPSSVNS